MGHAVWEVGGEGGGASPPMGRRGLPAAGLLPTGLLAQQRRRVRLPPVARDQSNLRQVALPERRLQGQPLLQIS